MIELPEALSLAKQLNSYIVGKNVKEVLTPTKPHKFCWFNGDVNEYEEKLKGSSVIHAEGFGIYVELSFDNGRKLCVNDGVNMRLTDKVSIPKDYQLVIVFDDDSALVFTVAMYGGIVLHDNDYDNEYYHKSRAYISPFSSEFEKLYFDMLRQSKPSLSAKAFLATGQRFPGIGNGVVQDILFSGGIHPKRKVNTLNNDEQKKLLSVLISVLNEMTEKSGRDTEKDIFGVNGKYTTKMSKNTFEKGCPICGGSITKEAYLGGSVYYCAACQPLVK